MGCDGGSIVGRQELVKLTKRVVSAHSAKSQARAQANSCALSQQPLCAPVVACQMGLLLNKDALLEYMLAKQKFPHFSHITQLKDVSNVTLQWNKPAEGRPAAAAVAAEETKESDATSEEEALYSCPITGLTSNGVNKFVAMMPCGCVVSERALRNMGGARAAAAAADAQPDTCMVCSKPLAQDAPPSPSAASSSSSSASSSPSPFHHPSYRTLFPGPEETLWLRAQIAERIKQREAEKAAKKAAKKAGAATGTASAGEAAAAAASTDAAGQGAASASGTVAPVAGVSATPAAAAAADVVAVPHKRKAEGDVAVRASKKAHSGTSAGAHATLVNSRTGNTLSDTVRAITAQAAAAVAERRKDQNFNAMFLTQKQIDEHKYDGISTKPSSLMSML